MGRNFNFNFRVSTLLLVITTAGLLSGLWARHLRREWYIDHAAVMLSEYEIYDPDPTELIRIVNYYHGLGQIDALNGLKRFVSKYGDQRNSEDEIKLKVIISLLFEPEKSGDKLPTWDLKQHSANAYVLGLESWDSTVIELDGIPFETEFRGHVGIGVMPTYLIEWAANEAVMRDLPIRPCPNPFDRVDGWISTVSNLKYYALYRNANLDFNSKVDHLIRRQVFKMMFRASDTSGITYDEDWEVKYNELCSTRIEWDTTIQSYRRSNVSVR